jgi:hypothetical protein
MKMLESYTSADRQTRFQFYVLNIQHTQAFEIKCIDLQEVLMGKPEGKRPLGRPRRRWVDNIRMDLVEVGWGDVGWIGLVKDRNRWRALVNSVLNLRIP